MANTAPQNEYLRAWRKANRERLKAAIAAWRTTHPEKVKEYQKRDRIKRRSAVKAYASAWYARNKERKRVQHSAWAKANRDKCASYCAKRYATQLQATPAWSDQRKIAELYERAKRLTEKTGIRHDVDHIVPLKSTMVCGLHVHDNLQILTKSENSRKFNRHWPDMPQRI